MQTQDVLARLKRATPVGVPTSGPFGDASDVSARVARGDCCQNCGQEDSAVDVRYYPLVPGEPESDRNRVSLCEDCRQLAPTASGRDATHSVAACKAGTSGVDAATARDRDDWRCRGCGVRERIVVGDDLHRHAVVPIDAGGFRHAHNVVSVCPTCHRKVHG